MYKRYDFGGAIENQTSRLRPHPLNDKIYGSSMPDKDLQKSVEENGVFNPIIINRNKEILSGTRRWLAAKKAGFKKVPVITLLSEGATGLLGEQFLIESNRARIKDAETLGREFKELRRIEKDLAKERQREGGKNKVTAKGPEAGEAAAKAAAILGMGANKAKKLEAIVDAADTGSKKAKKILAAVNAGELSASAAYRVIKPKQDPQKLNEGAVLAKELSKLFKNGEVTRSKQEGLFHVLIKNLLPEQIRRLAKTF